MNTISNSPQRAFGVYLQAANSHDFDELRKVLSDQPIFYFSDATIDELDALRNYYARIWAAVPDEVYWAENVQWVALSDSAAVAAYTYHWKATFRGRPAFGKGRATTVFAATEHGWVITHEHFSPPPVAI